MLHEGRNRAHHTVILDWRRASLGRKLWRQTRHTLVGLESLLDCHVPGTTPRCNKSLWVPGTCHCVLLPLVKLSLDTLGKVGKTGHFEKLWFNWLLHIINWVSKRNDMSSKIRYSFIIGHILALSRSKHVQIKVKPQEQRHFWKFFKFLVVIEKCFLTGCQGCLIPKDGRLKQEDLQVWAHPSQLRRNLEYPLSKILKKDGDVAQHGGFGFNSQYHSF